jgi:hypothetical protein
MDGSGLEPGHNQWNKEQYQRGRKTNDNKFIEPALPPKPPPPFLQKHHGCSLDIAAVISGVIHQTYFALKVREDVRSDDIIREDVAERRYLLANKSYATTERLPARL